MGISSHAGAHYTRNAIAGSIFEARRACAQHADSETAINNRATAPIVYGSLALTPNRIDSSSELIRIAPARPIAKPIIASVNPSPKTSRRRLDLEAPSGARIPSSCIRP
jgi:hypothetical protein